MAYPAPVVYPSSITLLYTPALLETSGVVIVITPLTLLFEPYPATEIGCLDLVLVKKKLQKMEIQ